MHEDFQSTVWGLSDADGYLAERYNYTDPYGVSDSEDGSATALGDYASEAFHRKRLHGGFVEEVTELYDFRNRWLQPEMGSWLSRDKWGILESKNLYQALVAAPLHRIDVFGLKSIGSPPGGSSDWDPDGFKRVNCPGGCPCSSELDQMKSSCRSELESGSLDGRFGSTYEVYLARATCEMLDAQNIVCGTCENSDFCGLADNTPKTDFHDSNSRGWGATTIFICTDDDCNFDCSASCEKVLGHEFMHNMCMNMNPGGDKEGPQKKKERCGHGKITHDEINGCADAFRKFMKTGNSTSATNCLENTFQRKKKWYQW